MAGALSRRRHYRFPAGDPGKIERLIGEMRLEHSFSNSPDELITTTVTSTRSNLQDIAGNTALVVASEQATMVH